MGWSGFSVRVRPREGVRQASEATVTALLREVLGDYWRHRLPAPWSTTAPRWINWGADSLIVLQDPNDPPGDGPLTELTFWFYDGAAWDSALARHWLCLALRDERRLGLLELLSVNGYALADGAALPTDDQRFVSDGGQGLVVADGGPCRCPMCAG